MLPGGFLLYALGVVYLILGLVIINNHYFMPSLRRLSCRMRLSDDVAGVTTCCSSCALSAVVCLEGSPCGICLARAFPVAVCLSFSRAEGSHASE